MQLLPIESGEEQAKNFEHFKTDLMVNSADTWQHVIMLSLLKHTPDPLCVFVCFSPDFLSFCWTRPAANQGEVGHGVQRMGAKLV